MQLYLTLTVILSSIIYMDISFRAATAAEGITAFTFFMGPGSHSEVQKISFRPEDGLRFREKYEMKYGPKGKDLIERFGLGLGSDGPPVLDPDHFLNKPHTKKNRHYRIKGLTTTSQLSSEKH